MQPLSVAELYLAGEESVDRSRKVQNPVRIALLHFRSFFPPSGAIKLKFGKPQVQFRILNLAQISEGSVLEPHQYSKIGQF